jgi:SAM-dependent methyltransferase
MSPKPFSPSSEQNRAPILAVLRRFLPGRRRLLEIGSGTGQHAVYFGAEFPALEWQTSDLAENHAGIRAWLEEAGLKNVRMPWLVDALEPAAWPAAAGRFDAVFCANAVHIMPWEAVERLFSAEGLGRAVAPGGLLLFYGPYNYGGRFTSESNARFDQWLKAQNAFSGVRDFEAVDALARAAGFRLVEDIAMPANNRTLVWEKMVAEGAGG